MYSIYGMVFYLKEAGFLTPCESAKPNIWARITISIGTHTLLGHYPFNLRVGIKFAKILLCIGSLRLVEKFYLPISYPENQFSNILCSLFLFFDRHNCKCTVLYTLAKWSLLNTYITFIGFINLDICSIKYTTHTRSLYKKFK